MRRHSTVLVIACAALAASLAWAPAARADGDAAADLGSPKKHGIVVGLRAGGILPISPLSLDVTGGVELGWFHPWGGHRVGFVVATDYASPDRTGSESDPRVAGGTYTWHLTERELTITPAVMVRLVAVGKLVPYAGLGARVYLLESLDRSNNDTPAISTTTEKSTKVGVVVPVGVELALGPGALTGELLFQFGVIDHRATGDSNTGSLNLTVGYRLFL